MTTKAAGFPQSPTPSPQPGLLQIRSLKIKGEHEDAIFPPRATLQHLKQNKEHLFAILPLLSEGQSIHQRSWIHRALSETDNGSVSALME